MFSSGFGTGFNRYDDIFEDYRTLIIANIPSLPVTTGKSLELLPLQSIDSEILKGENFLVKYKEEIMKEIEQTREIALKKYERMKKTVEDNIIILKTRKNELKRVEKERKIRANSELIIKENTILTKLLLNTVDVFEIIFSFLTGKELITSTSFTCVFFYVFIKSRVKIHLELNSFIMNKYPMIQILSSYKIYSINFSNDFASNYGFSSDIFGSRNSFVSKKMKFIEKCSLILENCKNTIVRLKCKTVGIKTKHPISPVFNFGMDISEEKEMSENQIKNNNNEKNKDLQDFFKKISQCKRLEHIYIKSFPKSLFEKFFKLTSISLDYSSIFMHNDFTENLNNFLIQCHVQPDNYNLKKISLNIRNFGHPNDYEVIYAKQFHKVLELISNLKKIQNFSFNFFSEIPEDFNTITFLEFLVNLKICKIKGDFIDFEFFKSFIEAAIRKDKDLKLKRLRLPLSYENSNLFPELVKIPNIILDLTVCFKTTQKGNIYKKYIKAFTKIVDENIIKDEDVKIKRFILRNGTELFYSFFKVWKFIEEKKIILKDISLFSYDFSKNYFYIDTDDGVLFDTIEIEFSNKFINNGRDCIPKPPICSMLMVLSDLTVFDSVENLILTTHQVTFKPCNFILTIWLPFFKIGSTIC